MAKSKKPRVIPQFEGRMIDTHCHLDYLEQLSTADILAHAGSNGVDRCITIAVSPENLDRVRALTREYDVVYGTQGVHPHEADMYDESVGERIRSVLPDPKLVAIGEIGLDYHYDHSDRSQQRWAFAEQLQIALDLDLPIVVHTRDADDDTMAIFREFSGQGLRGVIHSFTSSMALAEFCLSEGFHLGFNGIITFNKAENVREIVTAAPLDRILLETDAPFLTPVPFRGRENAPFYLPLVAQKVAELKGVSTEAAIAQTRNNAEGLFFGQQSAARIAG